MSEKDRCEGGKGGRYTAIVSRGGGAKLVRILALCVQYLIVSQRVGVSRVGVSKQLEWKSKRTVWNLV